MVELSIGDDGVAVGVAGDTYNTAVYLKRSGPGLDVGYATRLGQDTFSDRIVASLEAEGIDTAHVARGEGLPGLYAISTDDTGERTFNYWRSEAAARRMMQDGGPDFAAVEARAIYLSAITLAILPEDDRATMLDWLETARDGGTKVIFDSNYRPALWQDTATARSVIERAWRTTDIGLPSVDDELALYGDGAEDDVIARLGEWGVTDGALKRGAKGPRPLGGSQPPTFEIAPTEVIDTTAAGDSFNGGFLAAWLMGGTCDDAMVAGHKLACRVVAHRGAILPREE